jgi:hypothetical protein
MTDPVQEFEIWLRSLDADEIEAYIVELEAFEDDGSDFAAFAEAALPLARSVQERSRIRALAVEVLTAKGFSDVMGVDVATFVDHAAAIQLANKQLDAGTDPIEILEAALETSRAIAEGEEPW